MSFNFMDLNDDIRKVMLDEVNLDVSNNALYFSKRFNQTGLDKYYATLIESIKHGDETTFAEMIKNQNMFNPSSTDKNGRVSKTPINAHESLADGEFNRFYMRALAKVAIDKNKKLEVYRAKEVLNARSSSASKIGEIISPQLLLADLRLNIGLDTFLGIPGGVNSGLSVKLI